MSRPFRNRKRRAGRSRIRGADFPGKFEACTACDVFATEYGDSEDTLELGDGGWYELLHEKMIPEEVKNQPVGNGFGKLNKSERRFVQRMNGAIISVSGDGFVSVEWYATPTALYNAWDKIVKTNTDEDGGTTYLIDEDGD